MGGGRRVGGDPLARRAYGGGPPGPPAPGHVSTPARAAWDLAVGVDDRRPDWLVSVVPLYQPGTVDEVVELFDED